MRRPSPPAPHAAPLWTHQSSIAWTTHTHNHPPDPQNIQNKKWEENTKPKQKNKKTPPHNTEATKHLGFF